MYDDTLSNAIELEILIVMVFLIFEMQHSQRDTLWKALRDFKVDSHHYLLETMSQPLGSFVKWMQT